MSLGELFATLISALLTIMVLLYVLGDNPLFRLAVHLFIGVAAGYVGAVALRQVIVPKLLAPLSRAALEGSVSPLILTLPPLLLSLLLFAKLAPRVSWLGSPSMAYLVGVGAATAIGGAVLGTLFPQIGATSGLFDLRSAQAVGIPPGERLLDGTVVLVGTVTTLMYFYFGARPRPEEPPQRPAWIEWVAWAGQAFIALTFGVLFAGAYAAALSALIERLNFLWSVLAAFL